MACRLAIRVTPRSSMPGIGNWRVGPGEMMELEVRVAEAPAGGAANAAVVKMLAKALGLAKSDVQIISGEASRHKRVALPLELADVRRRLG